MGIRTLKLTLALGISIAAASMVACRSTRHSPMTKEDKSAASEPKRAFTQEPEAVIERPDESCGYIEFVCA